MIFSCKDYFTLIFNTDTQHKLIRLKKENNSKREDFWNAFNNAIEKHPEIGLWLKEEGITFEIKTRNKIT